MEQALNHWSAYWQAGARHSLPQDFVGNYDRELGDFWDQQFANVAADARILDVCTGSGAIALLAIKQVPESVRVTAVDGASLDRSVLQDIWPEETSALAGIDFIFGVPIESLTEDRLAGPVDLVTSQYGLEYCDLDVVAPILADLIKPGGRLVMVTHAVDSDMAQTMAKEASDYQCLVDQGYFKVLGSWAKNQLSGQDLVDRLNRVISALMPMYQKTASPLLAQVIESTRVALGQPIGQLMSQGPMAGAYLTQLQAAHQRLLDMQAVTEKIGLGEAWLSPLTNHGLVLQDQGQIKINGEHLAGLTWALEKPS